MTVKINMFRLFCERPNDSGFQGNTDEVIMVVTGKKADGTAFSGRIPSQGEWDGGNTGHLVAQDILLLQDFMSDGQSVDVTLTFVEVDSGGGDKYVEAGNKAVDAWQQGSDNPNASWIAVAVQTLISVVAGFTADDLLGVVSLKVTLNGGQLSLESSAVKDTDRYFEPADPVRHYYHLTGSGGRYSVDFEAV